MREKSGGVERDREERNLIILPLMLMCAKERRKRGDEEVGGERLEISSSFPLCVMDIMWPISQLHFHVSHLCSLK